MNKVKSLLLTLVFTSLATSIRPLVINKNTPPKWTYQTIRAGTLDGRFGTGGIVTAPIVAGVDKIDRIRAMQLQSDGKIVVVGYSDSSADPDTGNDFALARYLNDVNPLTQIAGNGNGGIAG
jgi:hypothetical protein